MAGITIKLSGAPQLIARLKGAERDLIHRATAAGLYAVGNEIIARALPITPKRIGTLRKSGHCTLPKVTANGATCEVGFGGPAVQYAKVQHDGFMTRNGVQIYFRNYTEPGTGPEFLAKAVAKTQPDAMRIFQRAFQGSLKAGGGLQHGDVPTTPGSGGGSHAGGHQGGGKKKSLKRRHRR